MCLVFSFIRGAIHQLLSFKGVIFWKRQLDPPFYVYLCILYLFMQYTFFPLEIHSVAGHIFM